MSSAIRRSSQRLSLLPVMICMLSVSPPTSLAYPSFESSLSSPSKGTSTGGNTSAPQSTAIMSPINTALRQPRTVMVTGANGFLASYIVRDLLARGHTVHACVRDATKEITVKHLRSLPGAGTRMKLFSTGDLAEANSQSQTFDIPMRGCDAVFHAATPLSVKFGGHSGENDIYRPAMISTRELLDCMERQADRIKCLVLTSSMAAVAPRPEAAIKDESHWSDPDAQRERGNWYGCTKTSQELLVRDWVRSKKASGTLDHQFVYAAICPTMVLGSQLRPPDKGDNKRIANVEGTMGTLQKWLREGKTEAPNDSMSFIHVEDCAKMHTRILDLKAEDINEHQRYMSLIESLHWNEILHLMKELYPKLPPFQAYSADDKVKPTQFNLDELNSLLQGPIRSTRETLQDSIQYLQKIGALD
jgi:cinnamoyl-CoA reductase